MKKIIPLTIAIIGILNSCSKDDEMFIDRSQQEERKTKNGEIPNKRDVGYSVRPFMNLDSIQVNNGQHFDSVIVNETQQNSQEDPPVKNGNHWKNGN